MASKRKASTPLTAMQLMFIIAGLMGHGCNIELCQTTWKIVRVAGCTEQGGNHS